MENSSSKTKLLTVLGTSTAMTRLILLSCLLILITMVTMSLNTHILENVDWRMPQSGQSHDESSPAPAVSESVPSSEIATDQLAGKKLPASWHPHANLISPKIWQIMLPKGDEKKPGYEMDVVKESLTWIWKNPNYDYNMIWGEGAVEIIKFHYPDREDILETFNALPNVGMKSDLLRYLILLAEGGVYSDNDTRCVKPIDEWVPEQFRDEARLVVGYEWDGSPQPTIPHHVQFAQWTIAAAPGHRVFENMIKRAMQSVAGLADKYNTTLAQVTPTPMDVYNSTGPAAWTDVIFEQLQKADGKFRTTEDLKGLQEPMLVDDILVLPINGFGMGQGHSGSVQGDPPEAALIHHLFAGTW